ncbi:hypothetical protein GCM10009792_24820 [Microcella alkalica]|uniref:PH domain-containing protein n=1 Tax=Microcella alkalica TaxID=355930 RepID=A0A839E8M0_9MICO|nr:hypothetical protein [Microcella alkalica]MBA8848120.1 hypothetical protein [Microcella alkalica]
MSRAHDAPLVVRPRRRLLRDGLLAIGLVLIVLGAPLLLTVPNGNGPVVIAAAGVVVVLCVIGVLDFARAAITITEGELVKRAFLTPPFRVPLDRIESVHVLEVYPSGTTRSVPQLLALSAEGERLFRMRGQFWTRNAIDQVAEATKAVVIRSDEPLTQKEFHDQWQQAAYWYENRPVLAAAGFTGAVVVAAAIVYGMLVLADAPLNGA